MRAFVLFSSHVLSLYIKIWVMLTCALRAQVKEFKKEIKNKFYIESLTFATFETLNAQVPRKTFYICLPNLCPKGTS